MLTFAEGGKQLVLVDHGEPYGIDVSARPDEWLPADATTALIDLVAGLGRDDVEWTADRWDLGLNTKDPASGFVGYVLRFDVYERFAAKYEPRRVGGAGIEELWVPAGASPEPICGLSWGWT